MYIFDAARTRSAAVRFHALRRAWNACLLAAHKRPPPDTLVQIAVFSLLAAMAGCDVKEQKPKTAASAITLMGVANAQQADTVVPPTSIQGAMQPVDEAFALFAASSALAVAEGARLVLKTTRDPNVQDYAQKLLRDHGRAHEELRRLAGARGLALPAAPTGRHADMVTKLSGVQPPALDDAFLQRFGADAHKEAIALFERHASEGKDPALRRHAEQTLPVLREHISAATQLLYAAAARR